MPLFDLLEVFNDPTSRSAPLNMALDEALFECATHPIIRFYRWSKPALSFGYFGQYSDVERHADERDLVRRWTGGGIVFHGKDLTYSLIVPRGAALSPNSSVSLYAEVHAALRDALAGNGLPAELARFESRSASEACFSKPVVADVMVGDIKVAGAAQRRTKRGILQQGSIQQVDLPDDFSGQFARCLATECRCVEPGPAVLERAERIAENKYARSDWLRRR